MVTDGKWVRVKCGCPCEIDIKPYFMFRHIKWWANLFCGFWPETERVK